MNKKIHVIAHTHWDYEWYFTNNESLIQLCYHVDEVIKALEEGYLDYYMLDGQMSIVEDYLQVNSDKKDRLMALVQAGKLKIGPWYTQADQMIVRGESLVRNLQIGLELGELYGGADRLGYIPDAFGQSIDMPKIFSQMGIEQAVFWRGLASDTIKQREFYWESEDGSSVLAYNIKDGYFVGVQLIENDAYDQLMMQIERDTVSSHIGLPVGGDQRYIDFNLKDRIQDYNANLTGRELVESNYDELFRGIRNELPELPVVQGEQLHAEISKIHRSIYSSRYDHKRLNDQIERRLIYQVEPLMVIAERVGIPYKKELVDDVWKKALRNHAHDSAGSCNSDKTNDQILHRLIEVDELSFSLIDYLTRKISESRENVSENQITLFNTFPYQTTKMTRLYVSLTDKEFSVYHHGCKIPYQLIDISTYSNDPIRRDVAPTSSSYYYEVEIVLPVELQPLGYEVLDIVEGEQGQIAEQHQSDVKPLSAWIENDYYKIEFVDGKINLEDQQTKQVYYDFLYIEDSGDDGDNYDYSYPENDNVYKLDLQEAEITVVNGEMESSLVLSGTFAVPFNLEERAADKCHSEVPYEWTLTLRKNDRLLHTELELENKALDHRMRMMVNGGVETDVSIADTPFGTISRPVIDPHLANWRKMGWKEEPTGIYPFLDFVNLHDTDKSVTVFSKGIKEYEIVGSERKRTALTLFRAVGYLGKPDLLRRPGVASGNQFRYIETRDSQMQKSMTFSLSIAIEEQFQEAEAFRHYQDCAVSVPYYQQQTLNQFTTPLKYFVMQPLFDEVPETYSMLDASSVQQIVFSSIKMARSNTGMTVRFFNPTSETVQETGELRCHIPISSWCFVTMEEENPSGSYFETQTIQLGTFKPKEIKTVYIQF